LKSNLYPNLFEVLSGLSPSPFLHSLPPKGEKIVEQEKRDDR